MDSYANIIMLKSAFVIIFFDQLKKKYGEYYKILGNKNGSQWDLKSILGSGLGMRHLHQVIPHPILFCFIEFF